MPGRLPGIVCLTVADGAPLRWLTAYHGAPVVNWAAMARDWAQDAVISVAALYGLWLATSGAEGASRQPGTGRRHRRQPRSAA